MHSVLFGAFALLLPIGVQFLNVAVMQCLLLSKRAGRRKNKDFKKRLHFIKTFSGARGAIIWQNENYFYTP